MSRTFSGLGRTLVGAFAGVAAVSVFKGFIADAEESRKVARLTAQVIKTTGRAAHVSAKQVDELATAISNKTGIDDEAIASGENLLLTFTGVRNEVGKGNKIFDRATGLIADMSVALGQDMKAGAIQLGKALNDPIKGVTALSRVGVSFTKQQRDQIKVLVESGRTLDAQKIILNELGKEFGGAAAAAATPTAKLRVAMGNLGEDIGTLLLPAVDRFATFMNTEGVPAIEGFIEGFQDGTGPGGQFADVIDSVGDGLQTAWKVGKPFLSFIADHPKLFTEIAVGAGGFALAMKTLSTVKKLPGLGSLLGGGGSKGGILGGITKAAPLPVFVTNPGGLGGPGTPVPPVVGTAGKAAKGAGVFGKVALVAGTVTLGGELVIGSKVGHDIGTAAASELNKHADRNLSANQTLARSLIESTIKNLGTTKGIESPEMIAALNDVTAALQPDRIGQAFGTRDKKSVDLVKAYDFLKKYGAKTTEVQQAIQALAKDPTVAKALRSRAGDAKRLEDVLTGGLSRTAAYAKAGGTALSVSLGGGMARAKERADDLRDGIKGIPNPRINAEPLIHPFSNAREAVDGFLLEFGKIPSRKDVRVEVPGLAPAQARTRTLLADLRRLDGETFTTNVKVIASGSGITVSGGSLLSIKLAEGGWATGAGTATSDSIPARLSKGEFVMNARSAKQWAPQLEAMNAGRAPAMAGAVTNNYSVVVNEAGHSAEESLYRQLSNATFLLGN